MSTGVTQQHSGESISWGSTRWYKFIEESVQELLDRSDKKNISFSWTERFNGAPDPEGIFGSRHPGYRMTIENSRAHLQIGVLDQDAVDMEIDMPFEVQLQVATLKSGRLFNKIMEEAAAAGSLHVSTQTDNPPPISFEELHDMIATKTTLPQYSDDLRR